VAGPSSELLTFIFCVVVKNAWSYISHFPHTFMKWTRIFFLSGFIVGLLLLRYSPSLS